MKRNIFLYFIVLGILLVVASLVFVTYNRPPFGLAQGDVGVLAEQIVRGEDEVLVQELSDWLVQDRQDFMLVDIRSQEAFALGHIRNARHIPLTDLVKPDALASLPHDQAVIVYANASKQAAQAALILRLAGVPAYSLAGGYRQWSRYLTEPASLGGAGEDALEQARHQAVNCYFEGEYVAEAGLVVKTPTAAGFLPPLQPVQQEATDADPGVQADPDPLGLGLGLEVDSDLDAEPGTSAGRPPAGLKIGEGC